MHPLTPAQRIRRWSAYLWVWRVHRWLALSLGLVIVLLSLTGGILVMHEEVERWLAPERHVVSVPANPTRAPLVPLLRSLQTEAPPGFRPLRLEPGHGAAASDKIVFVHEDRTTRWSAYINPYTAEVLWRGADQSLITPWLLHLHMHLQAGRWGYLVTGVAATALTLLSITGVWITRDRIGALLRHPLRFRFGSRVAAADLHKWIGIASLYFTFVLGATGVWFAILIVPAQFKPAEERRLAPAFDLAQLTAIEPAIASTLAEFPNSELARVIFPWDAGIRLQVRVLHRDAPIWAKTSRAEFDPITGAHVKTVRATDASTADKWRSILGPLHFGYYGSPLVKWLYVVGGFAPAALALTGTMIWWLRRRNTARRSASAKA
ncbi:MAG TPA: PepSY-associated TM helix domain-containing protein [Opitutus sp.]|nr:PepSY-associated TM helix domain-containing protein [Opitutus sp.]